MVRKLCLYFIFIVLMLTILIIFSTSTEASPQDWNEDIRLTNSDDTARVPDMAVSGQSIHVVWADTRDGNDEIYYKRSTTNGDTWGNDVRLTNNDQDSSSARIAVDGNNIHVVWADYRSGISEIYYKMSTNNGDNWGNDIRLTSDDANDSYSPDIAVDGDYVHVVWEDTQDGGSVVYYARSTNNGNQWGSEVRLSNQDRSREPKIAVNNIGIHIVWFDERDGNSEIYYKRSNDLGNQWGNDIRLTMENSGSWTPNICVQGLNIHIIWYDGRNGDNEIYYKRSVDNGDEWGNSIRITNHDEQSSEPDIAVNDQYLHIVWRDRRDGNAELYYKISTDNGDGWSSSARLTNNNDYKYGPILAVEGSNVHVVWYDYRDGKSDNEAEIYYKNRPNIPPIVDSIDFSATFLYRSDAVTILINGSDDNDPESELVLECNYMAPSSTDWTTNTATQVWDGIAWIWSIPFNPDETMETGAYNFRARFQDKDDAFSPWKNATDSVELRELPIANLTVSSINVLLGEQLTFYGNGSTGSDLDFYFDFGDGSKTDWINENTFSHTYSEKGTYTAKLKVRDSHSVESLWGVVEIIVEEDKDDSEFLPGFGTISIIGAIGIAFISYSIIGNRLKSVFTVNHTIN